MRIRLNQQGAGMRRPKKSFEDGPLIGAFVGAFFGLFGGVGCLIMAVELSLRHELVHADRDLRVPMLLWQVFEQTAFWVGTVGSPILGAVIGWGIGRMAIEH
jgi:hypothetical protein